MKTHEEWTMVERKPETLDFVKDFQEYLTQQTQHVNMISGSISADRESETLSAGLEIDRNRLDLPSVGASLEENPGMLVDGFERTCDGKLKCSYCNYASKGTARLIEHIRIHTGEKPHRCHLCPFASAYERHLEAHMRSHTGEKPYKCDLCSFRCSDRSNLSHHRRRRHKLLPMRGTHSALSSKRTFGILHRKSSSLGYNRRLLVNFSTPLLALHKPDHLGDFGGGSSREAYGPAGESPLDQLSTLAGQLAGLPLARDPPSPEGGSYRDEKPLRVRPPVSPPASPVVGPGSEHSTGSGTSTPSVSNSQPSTPPLAPPPAPPAQDHQLLHSCPHCDTYFADNILFTIHMGCHGYENPFQCNICGCQCKDQYDFACHFARGQHK